MNQDDIKKIREELESIKQALPLEQIHQSIIDSNDCSVAEIHSRIGMSDRHVWAGFFVDAPERIAALLDEIERLQKDNAMMRECLQDFAKAEKAQEEMLHKEWEQLKKEGHPITKTATGLRYVTASTKAREVLEKLK